MPGNALRPDTSTVHLPRLLCLHGGGVNATIFKAQLRSFLNHDVFRTRFRCVFAEAPYVCDGDAVAMPVYGELGPFRRWVRWSPEHAESENWVAREKIVSACVQAMEGDEGIGQWIGLLGFSQGAKIAASLLYEMQVAREAGVDENGYLKMIVHGKEVDWRFGILMAGRAPFVALSAETEKLNWCQRAGILAGDMDMKAVSESLMERPERRLRVPTLHVHGLKDPGLTLHRVLLNEQCAPGTTVLLEWDGVHRVPLKKGDVDPVVEAMVHMADKYGV